jgi:hypothetical protein
VNSTITDPFLGLVFLAIFFYVLFLVIRAGVSAGVRRALREDLLAPERPATTRVPDRGAGSL